jgi:hypothetical protein
MHIDRIPLSADCLYSRKKPDETQAKVYCGRSAASHADPLFPSQPLVGIVRDIREMLLRGDFGAAEVLAAKLSGATAVHVCLFR